MRKCRMFPPLLILTCLFFLFPGPRACSAGEDTVIRVLLTRPALTDRIDLSLDGSYSIDSLAFQRGSSITVSCTEGKLRVYYEGIAFEHGTSLRLVRHPIQGTEENGLRINHAYPLHPGDLLLTVRDNVLRAVLYIDVEEYLCGVIPYEMSDTYPLEALKAQAVAARTYALGKKAASVSDYDVTDNTNDQVYYGLQKEHLRSIQAVRETAGLCGLEADGSYAQCYYCASNGGQTESVSNVWGGADLPYLTVRLDPCDLENPSSTVRSFQLDKTPGEDCPLTPVVLPLLEKALEERGITARDIRLLSVRGAEPVLPAFEGSLCFTGLKLDLTAEYPVEETEAEVYFDPEGGPQESPDSVLSTGTLSLSVTVPVFPDLLDACELTINPGSGNELLSVQETENAFVLQSRRYGHGVGLSQRGAQWMAQKYGMDYLRILEFYYPGLRFAAISPKNPEPKVTAISMAFLATPGPAASPTPRPTLMPIDQVRAGAVRVVSVTNISENSYLNLRALPSLNSPVICQLYYGQLLAVTEETENGWLRVKTDSVEGYVVASYVQDAQAAISPQ